MCLSLCVIRLRRLLAIAEKLKGQVSRAVFLVRGCMVVFPAHCSCFWFWVGSIELMLLVEI